MIDREIKYNRHTKDFDCFVDSRYVGSRPNYRAGDELCNEVAYDLCEQGLSDDVPTDNPDIDSTPGTYGPEQASAADAGYTCCPIDAPCDKHRAANKTFREFFGMRPLHEVETPLLTDVAQVIDMALGKSYGAVSVVSELRRVRARVAQAMVPEGWKADFLLDAMDAAYDSSHLV